MFWLWISVLGSLVGVPAGLLVWLCAHLAARRGWPAPGPRIWLDDGVRMAVITGSLAAVLAFSALA